MTTAAKTIELTTTSGKLMRTISPPWLAVLAAGVVAVATPWILAGWASMLVNCAAIFLALKHAVWLAAGSAARHATSADRLAFYTCWPGFDVGAFVGSNVAADSIPRVRDWLAAIVKTALAVGLLWGGIPWLRGLDPVLVGTAGMLCGVLLVHCGLFHLVALAWQTAGRPVTPIMNSPLAATSLVDFWSHRWNLAFRDAVALVLFRPLARRFNPSTAMIATFLFSGLWHEAAISLPARGGYGLPTLYFLLQGLGMAIERRRRRGRSGVQETFTGRLTTALIVFAPLPLLFHRPFAEQVIVPLLHVLGAL